MQERALNAKTSRLLVVDDDASNRHMLSRRLERRGYTVEVAENGHEALEKIHSAHYDLVLLDQMMPGMTGLDLLRLLRATYSQNELPVIMVTAVDQSESVVEALNEGANDYVVKPADLPVMDARIHIQLARAQAAQSVEQTALREQAQTRMTMAVELNRAIERNQLVAYYQPKVHLPTRAVVGFEALLRWQHPRRGLIAPGDFIPMAEETGSILPIGEWILNQACRQLRIWHDQFPSHPPLSMNVNLSVKQLGDPKLLGSVRAILDHTGIPPETLKLELTESSVIKEMELARGVLAGLRDMRVGLKLDDFGTGYSSLNYLRDLSFDSLKFDRSFISRVACDQESSAIVEAILSLARNLNMSVVAEGIENEEQLAKLVALGCDTGQGFLFARPLTAEHAGQLLLRRGEMTGERGE